MIKEDNVNPMSNIYKEFTKILKGMTIKYNYLAEKYETLETKQNADAYIDAMLKRDTFLFYRDYQINDFHDAGIYDNDIIKNGMKNVRSVPNQYRNALLEVRRARNIKSFEEQNDYYRMLNGYPPLNTDINDCHFVTHNIEVSYGISTEIPIHKIQDYYNAIEPGEGNRLINILEGIGYIKKLQEAFPDETYLQYLGSQRIDLIKARQAKNFEILKLSSRNINSNLYVSFIDLYEQCRDYFVCTVYNSDFRSFMEYYDNFIAMCIMIMTTQQLVMKNISFIHKRDFFDVNALRMLYETYNIPYDLYIDAETQSSIAQNLNLLINNKATNKVIYDVADLLGFSNLKIYKYYLAKERKYDIYGVPIVQYTTKFNSDKGIEEVVPDYESMYEIYFQKEELNEDDFIKTFNTKVNKVRYDDVTSGDPYWWEDQKLLERKWEVQYNFVETKYMSLGISYKMTDILFENVLLLKLLMSNESPLKDVTITLPKIVNGTAFPLFDIVILLICMVAKKHKITGEVISVPTQIISVLDYLQNLNTGSEYSVNSFSFDFDYIKSEKGIEDIKKIKKILGEEDGALFEKYLSVLSIDSDASVDEKIKAINDMYSNIRGLSDFISYKMTDASNRKEYDALKTFYDTAFYAREMKDMFTIIGETTGFKRTAKNYFEFLHYYNPMLYSAIFEADYNKGYVEYCNDNPDNNITFDEYIAKIEYGEIDFSFDVLKHEEDETDSTTSLSEKTLYYYINHIISRMKTILENINFLYLINDSSTPLEELLVKIINFVKSFTVEMIGLDVLYICNMKPENILRFIDDVFYARKIIETREKMNLSYSDVVHKLITKYDLNDSLKFEDILRYTSILRLDKENGVPYNHIYLSDKHIDTKKVIETEDKTMNLFDSVPSYESTINTNDNIGLRDEIKHIWYSD